MIFYCGNSRLLTDSLTKKAVNLWHRMGSCDNSRREAILIGFGLAAHVTRFWQLLCDSPCEVGALQLLNPTAVDRSGRTCNIRNEANSSNLPLTCNICCEANSHDSELAMQHRHRGDFESSAQRLQPDSSIVGAWINEH